MEVTIDLKKSVDENAGIYFDKSKKYKKKLLGAEKALQESKLKLEKLQSSEKAYFAETEKVEKLKERKQEWYEKFRWFISSEGYLCVGGKDATTNEIIVKKHLEKEDLVFHTEIKGSPFFVIKDGQKCAQETKDQTAQATAIYSRAWKEGFSATDVFYVLPSQVTKEAQSGEHLGKGSFMVYGKKTILNTTLKVAIGYDGEKIIGGPVDAIKSKTDNYLILTPGREKTGKLSKDIQKKLGNGLIDDIIKFLPSGGAQLVKNK
jgi:predicted ribosome quality control (RQC) complex YloA/Tae2 family protein